MVAKFKVRTIRRASGPARYWQWLTLLALLLCGATQARAAVAVVSNRTAGEMSFTVVTTDAKGQHSKPTAYRIQSGDLTVVPLRRDESASLAVAGVQYVIEPDNAYYFGTLPTGKTELGRIGLGELPEGAAAAGGKGELAASLINLPNPAGPKRSPEAEEAARTITVKILVDEEEQSRRPIWERRLTQRVAAASEILERHCGMRLKVIGTDTWQSDNSITDFDKAMVEFTQKVDPGEARIAIGFTSQYQITRGRTHLGGTRGPLSRHILLREWSQFVNEPERLELLVHELGHFLGAVHSPETDSVMRVILGDKQARAKRFLIHFDPLNTLAMNLVAEEWQLHPLRSYAELSQPTRERLRLIYESINQALPVDPAAAQYLRILERTGVLLPAGSQ
jgi:hypothetical protein